ncbi:hypothetical protein COLO4_22736 [Corchorus olitorius]|uniref:BHLH domain-containing protein n=1 Tax=Corchorus olitorius TaxID=93759 RepID=A0A1R3IKD7_9ROSI|nr:hypothetical protein COLO4_22736 [Corchorus olitorius]
MENQFFLNAGIPPPAPPLHYGQSLSSSPMVAWQSLSSAMEIQATELNCSPDQSQSQDCFMNPNWEKSTDYGLQFESALSSMVSSPAASNSNNISNESFMIRELIGKLGSIGNSGEISPHLPSYINGNNSTNTSCYSTPLNSPPKLSLPIMDGLVKEKLPSLGKSMGLNSSVAEFSADPGFAERAAKFSCFGSRSFNGRTSQFGLNNNDTVAAYRSNPLTANAKLSRVSSSPSLKAMGSQVDSVQVNNKNSPLQDRSELANSQEESTLSEHNPNGDPGFKASKESNSRKRKAVPKGKSKETSASPNAAKESEAKEEPKEKRCKSTETNGNENGSVKSKTEEEAKGSNGNAGDEKQSKSNPNNINNTKPPEPPKDYIHVRARRGQATDSHSLAERVRREKISERMKLLQNLVPGCNKVTGKALMLDEIINYVQSLQRQVEFLSMKLASVNTRLDFNVDSLMSKDIFQSNNTSLPHPIFPIDSSATAFLGQQQQQQPQQNPALHSNISNGTMTQCSLDPLDSAATICPSLNTHLPPINQFSESLPQYPTFYEGDLQTIVQMGFGQNSGQDMEALHGSNQVSHMKVEL